MEFLAILVLLFVVIWLVLWLQKQAEPRPGTHVPGGSLGAQPGQLPSFKGQTLSVPNSPESYEKVGALLAHYVREVLEMEKIASIEHNQPFVVKDDFTADLQDFRYRVFLICALMLQGTLNTAEVYGVPASCGSPYFYPEIFAVSCEIIGKDLTELDSIFE
ncbi:MAG: hypothetical protein HY226_03970 [Candidatus Vogelbacteria bacterium]|nr:hypothetical protein [Candidatus Vogelbacteria bacterium]